MKKGIFLLAILLSFTSVSAKSTHTPNNNTGVNYRFDDAVTFIERGIEFHVFLDGGFDFSSNSANTSYYNYNGNRVKKHLKIKTDRYGTIRRIGKARIYYNFNGDVSRIGNIPVRYRFGQLVSVGRLKVTYDRWGYPNFRGFVKPNRHYNDGFYNNLTLGNVCDYDDVYFYNRNFRNNYRQYKEDTNFFYYKAVPNAKIGKRSKVIKRRKPTKKVIESNKRYLKNHKRNALKPNNRNVKNNKRTVKKTTTIIKPKRKNIKVVKTTKTVVKDTKRRKR